MLNPISNTLIASQTEGFSFLASMFMLFPLHHFQARVFQYQHAITTTLQKPIIHMRAVLLLSVPVKVIEQGENESLIMNFCDVFWIWRPNQDIIGFFDTQEDADLFLEQLNHG